MTTPDIMKSLVQRFEQHRDVYRSGSYNETQPVVNFWTRSLKHWAGTSSTGKAPDYVM